jgi:hypothetical protein
MCSPLAFKESITMDKISSSEKLKIVVENVMCEPHRGTCTTCDQDKVEGKYFPDSGDFICDKCHNTQ